MRTECCSRHRCEQITCRPCARRYAGRMARRLLSKATGPLYVIKVDLAASEYAAFWRWRIEARNLVDHRRRVDRWWRDFVVTVWLSADGHARGIVGLGSLTPAEVLSAFNTRWTTAIRLIELVELRTEVLAAVHPAVIAAPPCRSGRYQSLKFSIWSQQRGTGIQASPVSYAPNSYFEPMPVLI